MNSGTYCAEQNEICFDLFHFFYRVSFRRSRILSPTIRAVCECVVQRIAQFENMARRTVESFSLDEIENRGEKKLMTRIVCTHEIKTDFFFFNFNCTWSLQNEGEETLVVEDLDCNLSTVCDCFQMYHHHIKSCCSKSFATFN